MGALNRIVRACYKNILSCVSSPLEQVAHAAEIPVAKPFRLHNPDGRRRRKHRRMKLKLRGRMGTQPDGYSPIHPSPLRKMSLPPPPKPHKFSPRYPSSLREMSLPIAGRKNNPGNPSVCDSEMESMVDKQPPDATPDQPSQSLSQDKCQINPVSSRKSSPLGSEAADINTLDGKGDECDAPQSQEIPLTTLLPLKEYTIPYSPTSSDFDECPPDPSPWYWVCCNCGRSWMLSVTRRCYGCIKEHPRCTSFNRKRGSAAMDHDTESVKSGDDKSRPRKRTRRPSKIRHAAKERVRGQKSSRPTCRTHFDYEGWHEWADWREANGLPCPGCRKEGRECEYPRQCKIEGRHVGASSPDTGTSGVEEQEESPAEMTLHSQNLTRELVKLISEDTHELNDDWSQLFDSIKGAEDVEEDFPLF